MGWENWKEEALEIHFDARFILKMCCSNSDAARKASVEILDDALQGFDGYDGSDIPNSFLELSLI